MNAIWSRPICSVVAAHHAQSSHWHRMTGPQHWSPGQRRNLRPWSRLSERRRRLACLMLWRTRIGERVDRNRPPVGVLKDSFPLKCSSSCGTCCSAESLAMSLSLAATSELPEIIFRKNHLRVIRMLTNVAEPCMRVPKGWTAAGLCSPFWLDFGEAGGKQRSQRRGTIPGGLVAQQPGLPAQATGRSWRTLANLQFQTEQCRNSYDRGAQCVALRINPAVCGLRTSGFKKSAIDKHHSHAEGFSWTTTSGWCCLTRRRKACLMSSCAAAGPGLCR